ncbi:MAG: glycosyltransferase family 39 protein [Ktedonobacterales bacterium]
MPAAPKFRRVMAPALSVPAPTPVDQAKTERLTAMPTGASQKRAAAADEFPTEVHGALAQFSQGRPAVAASSDDAVQALVETLSATDLPTDMQRAIVGTAYGPLAAAGMRPYFVQGGMSGQETTIVPSVPAQQTRSRMLAVLQPRVLLVGVFVLFELVLILRQQVGPHPGEAISLLAGIRSLQGYGLSDGYLTWFAGSLLWPALAGSSYLLGGLVAARLLALLCAAVALVATSQAATDLFGKTAGIGATCVLMLCGPMLLLAHLALNDQIALASIAISFWAITKLGHGDERRWLVVAAVALAVGIAGDYLVIVCLVPLAGLVLVTRRKRASADLFILLFMTVALVLIYALPVRSQLAQLLLGSGRSDPSLTIAAGTTRSALAYLALPLGLLALLGCALARTRRRLAIGIVLLGGLVLVPGALLLAHTSAGAGTALVFGALFGCPLAGLALAFAWQRQGHWRWPARGLAACAVVLLGLSGLSQMWQWDTSWTDTRPAVSYLAAHIQPDETILASDSSPYQLALYTEGKLTSPEQVYDDERLRDHDLSTSVCSADWFIDEMGGTAWPASVRQQIAACGTFIVVYSTTTQVTQSNAGLLFAGHHPVTTTIWINVAKH